MRVNIEHSAVDAGPETGMARNSPASRGKAWLKCLRENEEKWGKDNLKPKKREDETEQISEHVDMVGTPGWVRGGYCWCRQVTSTRLRSTWSPFATLSGTSGMCGSEGLVADFLCTEILAVQSGITSCEETRLVFGKTTW